MTSNDLDSNLLEDNLKAGYPFEMEITSRMQSEDTWFNNKFQVHYQYELGRP